MRKRLESRYADVGFTPPYPTWPIRELAFTESSFFTPRKLLKRVEQHAAACLRANQVIELTHLEDESPADGLSGTELSPGAEIDFAGLDRRFAVLLQEAHIDEALDPAPRTGPCPCCWPPASRR